MNHEEPLVPFTQAQIKTAIKKLMERGCVKKEEQYQKGTEFGLCRAFATGSYWEHNKVPDFLKAIGGRCITRGDDEDYFWPRHDKCKGYNYRLMMLAFMLTWRERQNKE